MHEATVAQHTDSLDLLSPAGDEDQLAPGPVGRVAHLVDDEPGSEQVCRDRVVRAEAEGARRRACFYTMVTGMAPRRLRIELRKHCSSP